MDPRSETLDVSVPSGTRYQYGGSHGYYTDTGTGLMKLGARYYDPTIGRFITKDPARDGLNWYAYCGGNPVNAVDPSGLSGSYDPYGYSYGPATSWAKERHLDFLTPATRALDNSASAAFGWASETWSNTMGNQAWIEDNLGPALFSCGGSLVIGEGSLAWLGARTGLSGAFGGAAARVGAQEVETLVGSGGRGFVYQLDLEGGSYIGRTVDLTARLAEWGRTYGADTFSYKILGQNLNYGEMRGLEQVYIQNYGLQSWGGSLVNRINGVSLTNNYDAYVDAAWALFGK